MKNKILFHGRRRQNNVNKDYIIATYVLVFDFFKKNHWISPDVIRGTYIQACKGEHMNCGTSTGKEKWRPPASWRLLATYTRNEVYKKWTQLNKWTLKIVQLFVNMCWKPGKIIFAVYLSIKGPFKCLLLTFILYLYQTLKI